jgi:hypothetical protein
MIQWNERDRMCRAALCCQLERPDVNFACRSLVLILLCCSAAQAQSFRWIAVPGSDADGQISAVGLSDDGQAAAGNFGSEIWRWTATGGLEFPPGLIGSAQAISPDGQSIVGESQNEAFRWRPDTGRVGLGRLHANARTIAFGASNDSVVGASRGASAQAFRWTEAEGLVAIGVSGDAFDVSSDGSVIVGATSTQAFRWMGPDEVETIGESGSALGVSPDGSSVVGQKPNDLSFGAFYWTESVGVVTLDPDHQFFSSQASDVSDSGVVVGYGIGSSGLEAFRWTPETGLRTISSLLSQWGVASGRLHQAVGVSADGRWVVGNGLGPTGKGSAWLAEIPLETPPQFIPGDYNGNGVVEQGDLDVVLLGWGESQQIGWIGDPIDGMIEQQELDRALLNWGDVAPRLGAYRVPEVSSFGLSLVGSLCLGMIARRGPRRRAIESIRGAGIAPMRLC